MDDSWTQNLAKQLDDTEWSEFSQELGETSSQFTATESTDCDQGGKNESSNDAESDDDWTEEQPRPVGITDTLLQEPDINQFSDSIISLAPGEGNRPLGLLLDKDSEFLCFPSIYCGERRLERSVTGKLIHYSTICKWDLRNKDRRVARSVPNLVVKLEKLQIKTVLDTSKMSLRKCKKNGRTLTAGDIKVIPLSKISLMQMKVIEFLKI